MKDNDSKFMIHLQWFAEGDDDDKNKDDDKKKDDDKDKEKTFTQEEVNALIKKGTEKEQRKLLKELGYEKPEDIKAALAKLNELKDKAKPEDKKDDDKPDPKIDDITKRLDGLEDENKKLKAEKKADALKAKVIKAGADPDKADQVVKLLSDESDLDDDDIKKWLNSNTHFLKKSDVEDFGGESHKKTDKTEQQVTDRLRKSMGLTEKKK